jgi:hypothetical protein
MNYIEALNEQLERCDPCIVNAFILDFHELPEEQKFNFDYYDKDKHFILYCKKCKVYKLLPED